MAELESEIEKKLIDQLCYGDSQWTYRPDIRTEEQLLANFKNILEQTNKAKLDDTKLTDQEFAKVVNDVSHSSFYEAAKWQIGENGKVQVHVPRGNKLIHLDVLDNEQIAGGTSVYEVINQYKAFKTDDENDKRDRRFDVTLLINGIPLIHIELKNKQHSYIDGFRQIKKYIAEGKFHGLFSNVQMFIVSNAVDTKYFAAAREAELNRQFLFSWLDANNQPVCDYLEFAKTVLKIPMAHEIVAKYIVLDNDRKQLLLLRPYQIHAIESMRQASKEGKSGFIWHTTGSGKTMTSYKSTRNLLMDIPSIQKTVFLIDRKELDNQTKKAFQSYAENDTIDVDDTDNVDTLIEKLANNDRQMIVTTIQKMRIMIKKRLHEGGRYYEKIKKLKIAFVVDECHRAVTPQTKRDIETFFRDSIWFGFTGTPIFEDNKYEQKGDLPQTTDQLYGNNGNPLHSYTIKEAIHDSAVLGFMVENLGVKNLKEEEETALYESERHMRDVLNVILNQSYNKLGLQNGRGKTYEAILSVKSIEMAQKYYELLRKVVNDEDELKINEKVRKALPDFPKFAITYSITENEEASHVNQDKMSDSLNDYNKMFGTKYSIAVINDYNSDLNLRLARKDKKYLDRNEQLDLVIVVDRLLTGFDAPCLSTLFLDRQPMTPQNLIQALSRTNRLFDNNKQFGQIVTFQSPKLFKEAIDKALLLYTRGGDGKPISENWDDVLQKFIISLKAIRNLAKHPEDIANLSPKQKKAFVNLFRDLDRNFAHLKAFSIYTDQILSKYGFTQEEYENYAGMYKNAAEELKKSNENNEDDGPDNLLVYDDYELVAINKFRVDFEYIVQLLQGFVDSINASNKDDFKKKIISLREIFDEYSKENPKIAAIFSEILDNIEKEPETFIGKDMSEIITIMCQQVIKTEIKQFAQKWYLKEEGVSYEVYNYRNDNLANESKLKDSIDYAAYKADNPNGVLKYTYRSMMIKAFKEELMPEISPLLIF